MKTIRPSIARYQLILSWLRHLLQSYESVVGTFTNTMVILIASEIPHADELCNCIIDLIDDQSILCQRRFLMHKLVSDTRLHCEQDHSSQRVVFALGQMPTSLIPQLRHAKVETFLQTGTWRS